jgi:hypothetical protein
VQAEADIPYAGSARRATLASWEDMSSTIGAEETFCVATQPLADVNGPASYLGWGWLSISVPNLIVILVMILIFVLAIVLPFPKDRQNK